MGALVTHSDDKVSLPQFSAYTSGDSVLQNGRAVREITAEVNV
jgi:hypothetical protein